MMPSAAERITGLYARRARARRSRRARGLLVALFLLGCATTPPRPEVAARSLGFLEAGATTREQVLLKLGVPSRVFEGERVLTYRMGWDEEGGLHPLSYARSFGAGYDLVLVFDDAGLLQRWALVGKRE